MLTKKLQDELIGEMIEWQKMEHEAITQAGRVISKTQNPVIRMIMEIIRKDSQMHQHLQGFVVAHRLFQESPKVQEDSRDELRGMIVKNRQAVKQMIEIMDNVFTAMNGQKTNLLKTILHYLRDDERKHFTLLQALENALDSK